MRNSKHGQYRQRKRNSASPLRRPQNNTHKHDEADVSDCEHYTWSRVPKAVVVLFYVSGDPSSSRSIVLYHRSTDHQRHMPDCKDWSGEGSVQWYVFNCCMTSLASYLDYRLSFICGRISFFLCLQKLCRCGRSDIRIGQPCLSFSLPSPPFPLLSISSIHLSTHSLSTPHSLSPFHDPIIPPLFGSLCALSVTCSSHAPLVYLLLSLPCARTTKQNKKNKLKNTLFINTSQICENKGLDGPLRKAIIISLSCSKSHARFLYHPGFRQKKKEERGDSQTEIERSRGDR